ncbi:MAG: hypothetical protein ABI758_00105 [Candidatus Woesebacteria bacterium]
MSAKEKACVIKIGGSGATDMNGASKPNLIALLTEIGIPELSKYSRLALGIGGGPRVRALQATKETDHEKDMVARDVMWEHAEDLLAVAASLGLVTVPGIPHSPEEMMHIARNQKQPVVAMSWLKDKQSSDTSALMLAMEWQRQGYDTELVILSNVLHIFTADPKHDPEARPISRSSVPLLVKENVLIDDPEKFRPGMNVTIDPVAVSHLVRQENEKLDLMFTGMSNGRNVNAFLSGYEPDMGTVLRPSIEQTVYYSNGIRS